MRRVLLGLGVLSLAALAGAPLVHAQQGTIIQRVIVKVNGEPFTQKDLEERQITSLQRAGRDNLQGDALEAALTELMPDMLVRAVDDLLLLQRGKELNFHMTNEQFDEMVGNIKKENSMSDEQFAAALKQEGLSLDALRKRIEPEHIINQVQRNEVLGALRLTEQELRQYHATHPEEFVKTPTVTVRELLVATAAPAAGRGGGLSFAQPQSSEQVASEKIEALRVRAVGGEDFEKLVTEASDSPSKAAGGLIGPIDVTELAQGIRDALDKLQPGEVSLPLRTTRGYQLLKLEARTAAEPLPFEDVRDDIEQKLGNTRLDAETIKYLKTIRTQALLDWKRDDLRQMYEKRLAERTAAIAEAAPPAPPPATPPSATPSSPTP